ncbi:hypothetical protein [Micromonospora sp. RV43]|uniref:hypothetical protein n=1 Tax=Micromonospora sp. RV43 TaxID=1661387 RepID=UPI00064BBFAC|nr:hypothetical protein [Micromonospora sp. RV43]
MSGGWAHSTRRDRLPANWRTEIRPEAHERNPEHICHLCGKPGGDFLDHKIPGDDHSLDNLDWAHDAVPPHCHRYKSSAEGVAAQPRERRAREKHPGLL